MKHLIRIFCGCAVSLFGILPVAGEIIETNEIDTVLDYVNCDSIVFVNITGTLYQPSNTLSNNLWREYFAKRVQQIASDPQAGQALIDRIKNLIVQKIPKKTVEEKTPQLLAELQAKEIAVLGITKKKAATSYADNFAWLTQSHLANLGIHLDKTLNYLKFKDEKGALEGYTFAYGILFTNKQPEGPAIKTLLNGLVQKPSIVIVADNTLSSLENMQQVLEPAGFKFIGLRYGLADAVKTDFDPVLGTIEFFPFINEGKIMSDAVALELKQSQAHVNHEALIDDYIREQLKK